MGSVGNPNPWATYDNFKDCSQAICSIYCPQFCYLIFPPPPPLDDDSGSSFSPLIIAVIGVLATGLLLVSYYVILSRYCKRRGDHNVVVGAPDEVRGEAGSDSGQIPPNGLDESLIKNITVFKYQKSDGSVEVSDCAVCLSEFQENESLRLLPKCSHAFHLPCIDTWLKSHSSCPLCRAGVVVVARDPTTPPEAGTLHSAAVMSASPFEVHRPNDLTLVVDDQECHHEQVLVSLQNDREARDVDTAGDQEMEQFRRSSSSGLFSCRRHLLISDVLKIEELEEDLELGSGERRKHCIGSSNGFSFQVSESSPVDPKRSISASDSVRT